MVARADYCAAARCCTTALRKCATHWPRTPYCPVGCARRALRLLAHAAVGPGRHRELRRDNVIPGEMVFFHKSSRKLCGELLPDRRNGVEGGSRGIIKHLGGQASCLRTMRAGQHHWGMQGTYLGEFGEAAARQQCHLGCWQRGQALERVAGGWVDTYLQRVGMKFREGAIEIRNEAQLRAGASCALGGIRRRRAGFLRPEQRRRAGNQRRYRAAAG